MTTGRFAFAAPDAAGGTVDSEVFTKNVVESVFGPQEEDDETPHSLALHSFWFESHVSTMSDLRRQATRTEDDATTPHLFTRAKGAGQESEAKVVAGHQGFWLLDPSDGTNDKYLQMIENYM